MYDFDFFISYSRQDAQTGDDIAHGLRSRGYRVWFDQFEIRAGDSLRELIDDGLRGSRLGVLLLSSSYFCGGWTRRELDALLARDAHRANSQLVPVRVDLSPQELADRSLLLGGLRSISTADGIGHVLDELARRAGEPIGRGSPDLGALREQAERLADQRLNRTEMSRADFGAFQSIGRQLVDIQALESAPLDGPEPLDDPEYIALVIAARDFVYKILPHEFLVDLDRRGLYINQAVLQGDARWPVEMLEWHNHGRRQDLAGDDDDREQRGRLLRTCQSLLLAPPSLYFPRDMPGQVLRSTIPDLVLVIMLYWAVEVRTPEAPFRVLARLNLDHHGHAANLGKLRGQPALLIRTDGALLAWSPWTDPQPLAEIPAIAAERWVSDTHRLTDDELHSALVTSKGVLGLARDLVLYETRDLGHDDIRELLWLPDGNLICWHSRGLWRVRGSQLEPVLKKDDLLNRVRRLPDPRAQSCTAIKAIKSLTMASLHSRPLVLAVIWFNGEGFFDSLAALYLEIKDGICEIRGYLFPPADAYGLAPLPSDRDRDRVIVSFTQRDTPIRWYRSVGTRAATTFVEAGRLDADHRGIAQLAPLPRDRVAAYDADGKVTVYDLGGSTAPVLIHEGAGVRAIRLCDAATARNMTELLLPSW